MYRRFTFKPAVLIILLAISLMFGAVSNGHAAGLQPPPEGLVLEGKAVDGLLYAVVVDPADPELDQDGVLSEETGSFIVQHIVVICKEAEVVYGPMINFPIIGTENFADITAEYPGADPAGELYIEGWIFEGAAVLPPQSACFPEAVEGFLDDIIITRVKNFINTGTVISAEVTLRLGQQ